LRDVNETWFFFAECRKILNLFCRMSKNTQFFFAECRKILNFSLENVEKYSIFLCRMSKNTQISNIMEFCPLEVELLHADVKTDGRTWQIN
jgi:hypothetical protein